LLTVALLSSSLLAVFAFAADARLRGCFGFGAGFGEDGEAGFGESAFRKMEGEGMVIPAIWRSRFHPFATFRKNNVNISKVVEAVQIGRGHKVGTCYQPT
jgi:hypothetical protein